MSDHLTPRTRLLVAFAREWLKLRYKGRVTGSDGHAQQAQRKAMAEWPESGRALFRAMQYAGLYSKTTRWRAMAIRTQDIIWEATCG